MTTINLDRDLQQALYREKAQELYELWLGSPKAKQLGTIERTDLIFIRDYIAKNYSGMVCVEGLDAAVDAILALRRAEAEKVAAQLRLADQIEAYMTEHRIAQDDQAITVIAELQKDPAFSFDKFVTFVELHPEKFNHLVGFKTFSMLDAVRHAPVGQRELRRKYGDVVVDAALAQLQERIRAGVSKGEAERAARGETNRNSSYTQADVEADKKRREEEFKKNPLYRIQQAGWKRECENVVTSFLVALDGGRIDHAATQDARKELRQVFDEGVAVNTPWNVLRDQLRAEANRLAGIR